MPDGRLWRKRWQQESPCDSTTNHSRNSTQQSSFNHHSPDYFIVKRSCRPCLRLLLDCAKIGSKRLGFSAHGRFAKKNANKKTEQASSTVSKEEAERALSPSIASCKNDTNDPVASVYHYVGITVFAEPRGPMLR